MDRKQKLPPSKGGQGQTETYSPGQGPGGASGDPSRLPTATAPDLTPKSGVFLSPGSILGDRYRIETLLGRGGMGEVADLVGKRKRIEK